MLNLQCESSSRWLSQVEEHLDEILVDHAHCERKAAGTALNLLFSYVENEALCREMTEIVNEELEHFQQVLDLLKERDIPFRRLKPASYAGQLKDLVRKNEPQRAVDRLLVASLIEARSCERFAVLAPHVDKPLGDFYISLLRSEARHYQDYLTLAEEIAGSDISERVAFFRGIESDLISSPDEDFKFHSGCPV